jgi:glucose-1-phosphate adenylyltransferase
MRPAAISDLARQALAVIMAGGSGTRLGELTSRHSKPALPFGGQYRNIDFPLSNCINSGIRRITLLTQYKAHSLIQHVQQGWSFLRPDLGEFVELWPAQQRCGESWYAGTADAVYQNIDLIAHHRPEYVLVLAGDHVYKMDYVDMLEAHVCSGADVTVGCVQVPLAEARSFGVMSVDEEGWVSRFDEKPARPVPMPGDPATALASMGIYVFGRRFLAECLSADARNPRSNRDFGRDVLPSLIGRRGVLAYAFGADGSRRAYWRDVGTVDSYWRANMELLEDDPPLDLHDRYWPIRTHQPQSPPPRFIGEGVAVRSIVSGGCAIAGRVQRSVLSTNCCVRQGAVVESSVVLPDVEIGRNCRIRGAIIDHGCVVPDGMVIGDDAFGEDGVGGHRHRSCPLGRRSSRPCYASRTPSVRSSGSTRWRSGRGTSLGC